jgi:hypothetical protein
MWIIAYIYFNIYSRTLRKKKQHVILGNPFEKVSREIFYFKQIINNW